MVRAKRKTIAYYVSDHGWGHAARTIAILRALFGTLEEPASVLVKSQVPLSFLNSSLVGLPVRCYPCHNDFGFVLRSNSWEVDRDATAQALRNWLSEWEPYIEREVEFCNKHKVSLIVSDIAPQPFEVAYRMGIPSLAICNFTWDQQYRELLGSSEDLHQITRAYQKATFACVLPLCLESLPFSSVLEVSWVVRKPTRASAQLRQQIGADSDAPIIYLSLGRAIPETQINKLLRQARGEGVQILVSDAVNPDGPYLQFPSEDLNSQDYVMLADWVVSKAGYSTIAEAVMGRKPMVLLRRNEIPEDSYSVSMLEHLGIAFGVSSDAFLHGDWLDVVMNVGLREQVRVRYDDLPQRYRGIHGAEQVAQQIVRLTALEAKEFPA